MLVDQKVKKFKELLPCAFAMYDCRQIEDISSVENFIWLHKSYLNNLSGAVTSIIVLCHRYLVHLSSKDHYI